MERRRSVAPVTGEYESPARLSVASQHPDDDAQALHRNLVRKLPTAGATQQKLEITAESQQPARRESLQQQVSERPVLRETADRRGSPSPLEAKSLGEMPEM